MKSIGGDKGYEEEKEKEMESIPAHAFGTGLRSW